MSRRPKPIRQSCRECELRRIEPRFAEFYAHVERNRRADENLFDAMKRVTIEHALEYLGGNEAAAADLLSVSQQGLNQLLKRWRERRVEEALGNTPPIRAVESAPAPATDAPEVAPIPVPSEERPPVRRFDRNGKEVLYFNRGKPVYAPAAL